jgi:excisionase family DNA binding protein
MARDRLLTTGPAATYLGVGEQTLRDWVKAGKVPHRLTPSGRLRFTVADLDAMIRTVEPTEAVS